MHSHMLRVLSLNLNGIRSAANKGVLDWLASHNADIVCTQELKAQLTDLTPALRTPNGYAGFFHCAEKKGYSGVGIYSRKEPDRIVEGFGNAEFDAEGRYLQADFGKLSVVSLYLPSGSSSDERQQAKFRFLDQFRPQLERLAREAKQQEREVLLCGDWNIAHREIDLRNWRSNQKNSGFLPEERAWLDGLFGDHGFVDGFRAVDPRPDQYTWWSNRGQAWAKNVGWRIDYQVSTPNLRGTARAATIHKDTRFSDHAPLLMDYAVDG